MQPFFNFNKKYFLLGFFLFEWFIGFSQGAMNLEWEYYGPHNISGRAGQLLIDTENPDLFLLASKIGGIFKSENAGSYWDILESYQGHSTVNCLTQAEDIDKTIFLGTGDIYFSGYYAPYFTGRQGNGIWRSKDKGETWENLVTTSSYMPNYPSVFSYDYNFNWEYVAELKSNPLNPNVLLTTNKEGISVSENALDNAQNVEFTSIEDFSITPGSGQSIDIAMDGSVAFAFVGGRTHRSLNFQNNFKTGWERMDSVSSGAYGIVRVAPSNQNVVYVLIINNNSCLNALYRSINKGNTWSKVIEGGAPFNNDPFNSPTAEFGDCEGLGRIHREMVIHPTNENIVLIGGETLYRWNGVNQTFTQIDLTETEVTAQNLNKFLPAGKLGLKFNEAGSILYISTTRGIYKSETINEPNEANIDFEAINNNLGNVNTYDMGVGSSGQVLVGSESSGTILMCSDTMPPPIQGSAILEGTGGHSHISHFNSDYLFFSQPFGILKRSIDNGQTYENFLDTNISKGCDNITCFLPMSGICDSLGDGTYTTVSHLMEVNNKTVQQPTAFLFSSTDTLNPGLHLAQSANAPVEFEVNLNSTLLPGDTAFFDDPYDSKYFVSSIACGIWMCSNPFDPNPTFYRLTEAFNPSKFDHSSDGNYLYTVSGSTILILEGFNELELNGNGSTTPIIGQPGISLTQTILSIPGPGFISSISVDKNDPNHILAVSGSFGLFNKIWRITNALSANPVIEEIQNNLPQNIPLYDGIIDIQNSNNYIIASDFGIWASTDSGENWYQENSGLYNEYPIYKIKQVQLYEEACPVLYAGIHGRGVARSLSLTPNFCETQPACIEQLFKVETDDLAEDDYLLFPNPTNDNVNLVFSETIEGNTTVNIFNFLGNLLYSNEFSDLNQIEIDLSYFISGLYTVTVINNNQNFSSKTFIKQSF